MKLKQHFIDVIRRNEFGARWLGDKDYRIIVNAVISLIINLIFSIYNGILGITSSSVIFGASAAYYLLLGIMRFSAVLQSRKNNPRGERNTVLLIGVLLIVLSLMYPIIVYFSISQNTATPYDVITMITIATYTFSKITASIMTAVKFKHHSSFVIKAVNSIRYAEVSVSLLTMQQSMLVSFGGMGAGKTMALNGFTGGAVCILILILGITTLKQLMTKTEP